MANGVVSLAGSPAVRGGYIPDPSSIAVGSGLQQYNTDTALGSAFTIGQFGNVASLNVPSTGLYLCLGQIDRAALTSETSTTAAISQYSANTTTDHVTGVNVIHFGETAAAVVGGMMFYLVYLTAGATVYLKANMGGAVGDKVTGSLVIWKVREATA